MCEQEATVGDSCNNFILSEALIKGKGLQALAHFFYQILDKTRNVVL